MARQAGGSAKASPKGNSAPKAAEDEICSRDRGLDRGRATLTVEERRAVHATPPLLGSTLLHLQCARVD